MKKLLLSLGTVATIAAPVAAMVACGEGANVSLKNTDKNKSVKDDAAQKLAIQKAVDAQKAKDTTAAATAQSLAIQKAVDAQKAKDTTSGSTAQSLAIQKAVDAQKAKDTTAAATAQSLAIQKAVDAQKAKTDGEDHRISSGISSEKAFGNYNVGLTFKDGHTFAKGSVADGGDITIGNLIKQIGDSKVYSINRNHEIKASLVRKEDLFKFISKYIKQFSNYNGSEIKSETVITTAVNNLTLINDSSKSTSDILKEMGGVQKSEEQNSKNKHTQMEYIDFYRGAFIFGGEFIENGMHEVRRGTAIKQLEMIVNDKNTPTLDINKELNKD